MQADLSRVANGTAAGPRKKDGTPVMRYKANPEEAELPRGRAHLVRGPQARGKKEGLVGAGDEPWDAIGAVMHGQLLRFEELRLNKLNPLHVSLDLF